MDDESTGSGFHIDVETVDEIDPRESFDAQEEIGEDEATESIESMEMGPVEATMFFRQQHAEAVVEALQQRKYAETRHDGMVQAGYVGAGLALVNGLLLYQLGHDLVAGATAMLGLGVVFFVNRMEEPPGPSLTIPQELVEQIEYVDDPKDE